MKEIITVALVAYPLSQDFKDKLETIVEGPVSVCQLNELRQHGWIKMIQRLRAIRGQLIIPLEDPTSAALLPILQLLAACTKTKQRMVFTSDAKLERIKGLSTFTSICGFIKACVGNYFAYSRARLAVNRKPCLLYTSPSPRDRG